MKPTPDWLGWRPGTQQFALLAPKASAVSLIQRLHPGQPEEQRTPCIVQQTAWGYVFVAESPYPIHPWRYYRFAVTQPDGEHELADPWGLAQARQWRLGSPTWSVATAVVPRARSPRPQLPMAEQVVVEVHVRDATQLWKAPKGVVPGTYRALTAPGSPLLTYLSQLHATAVELLPTASYPVLEPSPNQPGHDGATWNPTGVNHWGYMPSFFLAVTERYADRTVSPSPDEWLGVAPDGSFFDPARELQQAIADLQDHGYGVIADVVWNHVSIADVQPLLVLDPGDWFFRDRTGRLRSHSGCGNDLNTSSPPMRALVLAAAQRWLVDLGADGLRLDLSELMDDETLRQVSELAHTLHPTPLLFAEPWSFAGYRPQPISSLGFAVWNDRYRNAAKGHHPGHGRGLAFGRNEAGATAADVIALLRGWPAEPPARHLAGPQELDIAAVHRQVHYLESHDDWSLGDFVRLALGKVAEQARVDWATLYPLRSDEMQVHRLLAALLVLSRGPVMLTLGQTWARPRWLADRDGRGPLLPNLYNHDDAASHVDWAQQEQAMDLHQHWTALLALRCHWLQPALSAQQPWQPLLSTQPGGGGYLLQTHRGTLAVLFCLAADGPRYVDLPDGPWLFLRGDGEAKIVPTAQGVVVLLAPLSAAVVWRPVAES